MAKRTYRVIVNLDVRHQGAREAITGLKLFYQHGLGNFAFIGTRGDERWCEIRKRFFRAVRMSSAEPIPPRMIAQLQIHRGEAAG